MSKQKVTFWLLCCTVLCFSVQRLEMQFRECFGYSREEFEEILAKHNREKEAEFMEGDVFGGLLMETVSAPLIAIEGIQNQWRARTRRKTDYSFLEERDLTRSEVTAGMGSIGTALYLGAAEITSQLTLGVMTLGQDKVLAGAMGIMYMDAMQHRKEREGVDELKAADTALLTGMADYCLGRLGYGSISRCVEEGVRKSLVRKMGESFLTGAGMALGSETGGQLIDWMLNGRLSEWGKIYNAHLDEGMSETEAFGEMVKAVGPELTVHTVAGGISGAGFAVIHMLAASKDNRPRKQETIEKTNQGGERNRESYGKSSGKYDTTADFLTNIENRNGKFYTDKATIDKIGQVEARGEDFSLLNKRIMSSRASTEGGTSVVYKYSDELGTKYLIHEVTDARGYIIHRDFDAVRISSGQLINKGH